VRKSEDFLNIKTFFKVAHREYYMVTLNEGSMLVELARNRIESHLSGSPFDLPELSPAFHEKSGVFVTLLSYPDHRLRGCIGYPEPSLPLVDGLLDAAISAAVRDPRFPPVGRAELDGLVVEVTVLTPPARITGAHGRDLPAKIKVGRDGLIVEKGFYKGLLLPQVPIEWGWDEEEFLSQTCVKAGLRPTAWLSEDISVFTFSGQIFSETAPRGKIVEKEVT
jgi:uncharacterized protein (TIGR00296 family)